jgi:hypothetical protein
VAQPVYHWDEINQFNQIFPGIGPGAIGIKSEPFSCGAQSYLPSLKSLTTDRRYKPNIPDFGDKYYPGT